MYSDEDLNHAIKAEIFTSHSVEKFRRLVAKEHDLPKVDEENFKLFRGFNDIFVVIASALMLISVAWIASSIDPLLSSVLVATFSWVLSELFVRQRKMPFPAITLLFVFTLSFISSLVNILENYIGLSNEPSVMLSSALGIYAVYLHWKRFRVPITVAIAMATFILFSIYLLLSISVEFAQYLVFLIFIAGLLSFYVAMRWDSADTKRISSNSDVAFWLHLLSSPLIVHSIFIMLGVFDEGENGIFTIIAIVILYALLSFISLAIDRRIFMISSIFYVLYAFSKLFDSYGMIDNAFALAGLILGIYLLLISLFWHQIRSVVVATLPSTLRSKVP